MEVAVNPLLAQLGSVCRSCSTYNEPAVARCVGCGRELQVVGWVAARRAVPPPAPPAPARGRTITQPGASEEPPPPSAARPAAPPPVQASAHTTIRRPAAPAMPGVACARCGRKHPASVRFCPGCGARLGELAGVDPRRQAPSSPIPTGSVRLVLLRGVGRPGSVFPVLEEITTLGRDQGAVRFPGDDTLASHAATLIYREGRLIVRDEPGGSGVFVRLRQPHLLREGELFAIGDHLLRFAGRVDPPAREPGGILRFGSPFPSAGTQLRIEVVHEEGRGGRAWVRKGPVGLGRALGDILFPDDPFVSARHCELDVDPAGALLRDLGSSNGTFARVPSGRERELLVGDTLRLGRNILRVDRSGGPAVDPSGAR